MRRIMLGFVGVIIAMAAPPCRADLLTPILQTRHVQATAQLSGPLVKDYTLATGFGPFAAIATASVAPGINATAAQDTTITGSSILGGLSAHSMCTAVGFASAGANSIMEVRFVVTDVVAYNLSGTFAAHGSNQFLANPQLLLSVNDAFGPMVELIQAPLQTSINFARTGTLQPGEYTLWANIFSGAENSNDPYTVNLDFNFTLTPSSGVLSMMLLGTVAGRHRRWD